MKKKGLKFHNQNFRLHFSLKLVKFFMYYIVWYIFFKSYPFSLYCFFIIHGNLSLTLQVRRVLSAFSISFSLFFLLVIRFISLLCDHLKNVIVFYHHRFSLKRHINSPSSFSYFVQISSLFFHTRVRSSRNINNS